MFISFIRRPDKRSVLDSGALSVAKRQEPAFRLGYRRL